MTATRACILSTIALWGGFFGAYKAWTPFAVCVAILIVFHASALVAEMNGEGE